MNTLRRACFMLGAASTLVALQSSAFAQCAFVPTAGDDNYVCSSGISAGGLTDLLGNNSLTFPSLGTGTLDGNVTFGGGLDRIEMNSGSINGTVDQGDGTDSFEISNGNVSANIQQGAGIDDFVMSGGLIQSLNQGDNRDTFFMSGGRIVNFFDDGDVAVMTGGRIGRVNMMLDNNLFDMSGGQIDGNLVTGFGNDTIRLSNGHIGGNISVSGGTDSVTITGGLVDGSILLSTGNDTLVWRGRGTVQGTIEGGPGDDRFSLADLTDNNISASKISGGDGIDRLELDTVRSFARGRYDGWETISLQRGSQFTVSETLVLGDLGSGTGSLSIDPTSKLLAGGSGVSVESFTTGPMVSVFNSGIIDLTNRGSRSFDRFLIGGHYIGDSGLVQLSSQLADDASPTDLLVIAGGSPSIVGHYSLADFGQLAVARLGAGEPLVISDNHEELPAEEAQAFQAIGITATICMPLVKQGRLTALMAIHDKNPRRWDDRERALLVEVTERCWAHIERIRSQDAARSSEERLRLATEAASIGIWDYNPISGQLQWDDKCKAMFGLPPEAPVTYEGTFLAGLHPDDRERADAAVRRALEPGSSSFELEYRTVGLLDRVERWIAATGSAHFEDGRAVRFIGTVIDITARKRVEKALQTLNATLEQRVAEEVMQRAKAEDDLRQAQKMEAVGQLTGGIAHDFNNMLAVVISGLNLASRKLAKGETDIQRFIEGAAEGAHRAAELTKRLLAFSRQQPLAPKRLNPNKLVSGMSELLTRTLGETIQVETVLGASLWQVEVDPAQLESALLNLSVNARDAMPNGGKLTIETSNAHIDARAAREYAVPEGQYVLLGVTDTGAGMSAEVLAKAFDPFFTTKAVGQGTGLGLSQVYGFVRQSGGNVKIYSEPEVGTTVKIYLPRSCTGAEEEVHPAIAPIHGGVAAEWVMVVEDEDRVRTMAVETLRELGYSVLEMRGPGEALEAIRAGRIPALLFTDVVMPEMSGRELVERVRETHPDLKVLYTTGYTRNAIVHNGTLDFGTELLSKPYSIEELAAKIRTILDR